jgi:membrane protease YdiL (CAAX protease family)
MSERPDMLAAPEEGSNAPETRPALSAGDQLAAALRGFGPIGVLAIVTILAGNELFIPLSAILVLVWVRLSRTPWREIGFVRPRSWLISILIGLGFGAVFKIVMKAIVMPLLGAPPVNPAYHFLAGNLAALPWMLYIILIGAGFGEETLFRGWMFERLGKLLGHSTPARIVIVFITAIWFGVVHFSFQGIPGVEQAFIVGLAFGAVFAITGRIFMLMIAHAAFDLTALALIFWDVESVVAHLVFR